MSRATHSTFVIERTYPAAPERVWEYRLMLNPVALGAGPTLFDGIRRRAALRLVDVRPFATGSVLLRYAPR